MADVFVLVIKACVVCRNPFCEIAHVYTDICKSWEVIGGKEKHRYFPAKQRRERMSHSMNIQTPLLHGRKYNN